MPSAPSLSIVIPAYNEARRLPATLRRIAEYLAAAAFDPTEVLVIDDGSPDRTGEAARSAEAALRAAGASLRVFRNAVNRGKGYSVRRGLLEARHTWVLFSDADLSAPIEEADKLFRATAEAGCAVAIGSRALDRSLIAARQPLYREAAGRCFNLWVRLLTGLDFADTQCGLKLLRRPAARSIAAKQRLERFGFDVELLHLARRLGFAVAEVPVRWSNAADSSVGWLAGLAAFREVWQVKWNEWRGRYD